MSYNKIFVQTSCPTTFGISLDMSKFWSANVQWPTVICSPEFRIKDLLLSIIDKENAFLDIKWDYSHYDIKSLFKSTLLILPHF